MSLRYLFHLSAAFVGTGVLGACGLIHQPCTYWPLYPFEKGAQVDLCDEKACPIEMQWGLPGQFSEANTHRYCCAEKDADDCCQGEVVLSDDYLYCNTEKPFPPAVADSSWEPEANESGTGSEPTTGEPTTNEPTTGLPDIMTTTDDNSTTGTTESTSEISDSATPTASSR